MSSSIRAVVRVRPLLPYEAARGEEVCCEVTGLHTLEIRSGCVGNWKEYTFDACIPPDWSQKQTFQESGIGSLIESVLVGYSATVLAYGQTGSGKTYTVAGRTSHEAGGAVVRAEGLVDRTARQLFREIRTNEALPSPVAYSVTASFVEISNAPGMVNECLCDLLNPGSKNLLMKQTGSRGFLVSGLSSVDCHSASDVRDALEAGVQYRRSAAHALNKDSSRSHALFTLAVKSQVGTEAPRHGKMTLVDLAGSERLKESGSEGHARVETQAINKSLFALGQVISQLANGGHHVGYRNSKLTQLLQDSFGGGSLCLMITCISPATSCSEESMHSLRYAAKAMHICNRPVISIGRRLREEVREELDFHAPQPVSCLCTLTVEEEEEIAPSCRSDSCDSDVVWDEFCLEGEHPSRRTGRRRQERRLRSEPPPKLPGAASRRASPVACSLVPRRRTEDHRACRGVAALPGHVFEEPRLLKKRKAVQGASLPPLRDRAGPPTATSSVASPSGVRVIRAPPSSKSVVTGLLGRQLHRQGASPWTDWRLSFSKSILEDASVALRHQAL